MFAGICRYIMAPGYWGINVLYDIEKYESSNIQIIRDFM